MSDVGMIDILTSFEFTIFVGMKPNTLIIFLKLIRKSSDYPLNDPKNNPHQEYQNGNFIDAMHHPDIDIGWSVRVRFSEYPEKIIPNFTKLKKLFNFIL